MTHQRSSLFTALRCVGRRQTPTRALTRVPVQKHRYFTDARAHQCRRMSRAFNKASRRIPQHSERNVSRERGLLRHKFLLARYERRRHLERVVYHRLTLYSSQDYTNVRVRTIRHHSKYAFASSILARFTKSLERRTSTGVMDDDD